MKLACEKCGEVWEARWISSGLCFDCAWDPEVVMGPATVLPGVTVHECTNCGRAIDHGEFCSRCDPFLSNLDTLR